MVSVMCAWLMACSSAEEQQDNVRIADTNVRLGIGYLQQGRVDAALEKFKRALDAAPDYAEAHGSIALAYDQLDDRKLAALHYERAIELKPADGSSYNNYAAFLCRIDKPLEAEQYFLKALASRGYRTQAQAYENLGVCAMKVPDLDKADKYLRKALQFDARLPVALLTMARVSLQQGNYLSGRGYLQRYLESNQPGPDGLWLAVQVEQKLGDKDAVRNYALQLRKRFPDSEETRQMLAAGLDKL